MAWLWRVLHVGFSVCLWSFPTASKGTTFIWSTVAFPEVRKTSAEMVAIISSSSSQNSLAPSIPTWPSSPAVPEFPPRCRAVALLSEATGRSLQVRSRWLGSWWCTYFKVHVLYALSFVTFPTCPDIQTWRFPQKHRPHPHPITHPGRPITHQYTDRHRTD